MAADTDIPPPPDVTNRQLPAEFTDADVTLEDLRRGEIETALLEGAWREGYREWRRYADVDDEVLAVAFERALFAAFDFYYDPEAGTLRSRPPSLPDDWVDTTPSATVSSLRTALDDLGEIVSETLADTYLDWTAPTDEDYVWREETFGTVEGEPRGNDTE